MKAMWGVAAFSALFAGLLTWVLGFLVTTGQSVITTTLALMFCIGGYWMFDKRGRRWSWILIVLALPLGFYFNYVSPHFQLPAVLGVTSLLFAVVGSTTRQRPKDPDAAERVSERDDGR